ncbi:MAG: hypothetical protein M1594_00065 [Candidatus Marsarchaeota archaeon]|nr:hypothetical protein [Candidatus Marsarchaeota archaeon]
MTKEMVLNLSKMSYDELKARLKAIDPNLVFNSRKNNVKMYKILKEHTQKKIMPELLNKKVRIGDWWSEETPVKGVLDVDKKLREDLFNRKVDFSKMPKTLQEALKETKFRKPS